MTILRKTGLLACSLVLLAGCYDITEVITINPSGTGHYETHMDLSQLVSMIRSVAAMDSSKDLASFHENLDSTLQFGSFLDTVQGIDPSTKAILSRTTLHLKMAFDSGIFKVDMSAPFDNLTELQQLQDQYSRSGSSLQALSHLLTAGKEGGDNGSLPAGGMGPDRLSSILKTTWGQHQITRTYNKLTYDSLMQDSSIQEVKSMSALLGDMKYKTIIHLPRPAIKVQSKASVLSDDRKTVTFEFNLTDIFYDPDSFTFTIDY